MFRITTTTAILSKNNIIILIVIAVVATLLSIFSYQYYTSTSTKIADIASHEIRTNAQIQVHDISQIIANRVESINALLQTLSDSPAIHNNEYKRAYTVINTRQQYSDQVTDFYMWLDKNGKLNWVSNINQSSYQKYKGTDLSYRPYFTIPRETLTAYYSTLIQSNDKVPRLYISYPVINMTGAKGSPGVFTGLVVASININTLGSVLKNQLFPQFNSTLGVLDKNGMILYANPLSFIGKNAFGAEMQSTFSSMLSPQAKDSLNNILRDSLKGNTGSADIFAQGKQNTVAYEPVNINGKYFLTSFISAPHNLASNVDMLIDQQKNFSVFIILIIGIIAFGIALLILLWNRRLESMVDIRTAELKNANEQLKVHDKMQKEFIDVASHEMKTPTQAILAFSSLLQKHPERKDEFIQAISRNAVRLQRLTNDILDVTRIESQTLKLKKEQFNLIDLISSIIDDFKNDIQRKGSDIKLLYASYGNQPIMVYADKERITQVISNLISNAIKFTNKGIISIHAATIKEESRSGNSHENVIVSIKDTGIGIDSEISQRLFTKFATKSETGGTGLGLFISKSIIEAHGGRMWADNNNNNNNNNNDGNLAKNEEKTGATFSFILPLKINKEQSNQK